MFTMLEGKADISRAQRSLEVTLARALPRSAVKDIGYPSGRQYDKRVRTDGTYWYWSDDFVGSAVPNPRRLNWFGLFNEHGGLGITVEINTAFEGRNDQVAGFFGRDPRTGTVYLFHSGRVGGGTVGVGKDALLAWSDLALVEVADSAGGIREGVLVMPVDGTGASGPAFRYVQTIVAFKQAVRDGVVATPAFQRKLKRWGEYFAEGRGRRRGLRSSVIDYVSRHGDVVDTLKVWRESLGLAKGWRFTKDVLIDLGVYDGKNLVEIFEVKTSVDRGNVYAGIGQLMVHGTDESCSRYLVLPGEGSLATDLQAAIKRLDIKLLRFELREDQAVLLPSSY